MNQKNIVRSVLAGLSLLIVGVVQAQDPHFSQYFQAPMYTNPALTGQINGNFRVVALYRSQWQAFGNAFNTYSLSADGHKDGFGYGLTVIDEVSGPLNFNTLSAMASGSYDISFKNNNIHHFVFGVQAGVIYNGFKDNDITTPDQYDAFTGSSEGNDLGEDFGTLTGIVPDVNFGVLYFNGSSRVKLAPFAGAAVFHLLEPAYNFGGNANLPRRYMVHGGFRYRAGNGMEFTPHVQYMYQNGAYNGIIGANVSYALIDTETRLEGGVSYRLDDAIVPYLGVLHQDFMFGVSFDTNVSSLSDVGNFKNALEFSLTYVNSKNKYEQEYICPRL